VQLFVLKEQQRFELTENKGNNCFVSGNMEQVLRNSEFKKTFGRERIHDTIRRKLCIQENCKGGRKKYLCKEITIL
jgi:hypothetical protein